MIWIILGVMLAAVLAFLMVPLLQDQTGASPETADGLVEVRAQLAGLETDLAAGRLSEDVADETRRALELRALELLDNSEVGTDRIDGTALKRMRITLSGALMLGTLALYALLGAPNFDTQVAKSAAIAENGLQDETPSLEALVENLTARLAADPAPPADGYVLLARSQMTLGRYEKAFESYQTALRLSDENVEIGNEYARARAYVAGIAQQPGPDAGAIEAAGQLSGEERQEMIDGMVARLATRLQEEPDDPDGWARLIRARLVLGQTEQAKADLDEALRVFEAEPSKRNYITDFAASVGLEVAE